MVAATLVAATLVAAAAAQASTAASPSQASPADASSADASSAWTDKVDPALLAEARTRGAVEFLVYLEGQADLRAARALTTKRAKGRFVVDALRAAADRTQPPLVALLESRGAACRRFWIANMLRVRGDASTVRLMAEQPAVTRVISDAAAPVRPPAPAAAVGHERVDAGVEWNIAKVRAPEVWALGYTGQGTVVGGQDTGYDWQHPAIQAQYRGWDGSAADHAFNWHDAIHANNPQSATPGNPCGFDIAAPCDDHGHGTHTMGTMTGDDGASNQIGMAPGARWIACRNMEEGWGTPSSYAECYQWFIAPTDSKGENADPDKAPDVINNSWGCTYGEGCVNGDELLSIVQNVRSAGILTVHSAGNYGSSCSTLFEPAATYAESFSVGAVDRNDAAAGFSSRGPVTVDGKALRKPDIGAPGTEIRSSLPGNGYASWQGTSMAGPHVAGLAALILSSRPDLAGNVDRLETIIEKSAVPLTTSEGCGGDGASDVPNNVFGWGRIDAFNAVELALFGLDPAVSAPASVPPGALLTYTLRVTNGHASEPAHHLALFGTVPAMTSFVSATEPHTFTDDTVRFDLEELAVGASWEVTLTVRVADDAAGAIVSAPCRLECDELDAAGDPVTTAIVPLDRRACFALVLN